MKKLLKTIGYAIGIVIFLLLGLIGFLYTLIKHIYKKDYSITKQFLPIVRAITLAYDGLANAMAGEMLTDTLLKHKKNGEPYSRIVKFGLWYTTISAITGVNKKRSTLNKKVGRKFDAMLEFFLGYNHSLEAINKCINYDCKD